MKEQLESLGYTDVKEIETDSGIGYVGLKNGGSIIIPPNYEKSEGLSMLVCGQGGTGNAIYGNKFSRPDEVTGEMLDGPNLIANAKNGEFPTNPVVIAPNDLYPGFSQSGYRGDPTKDLGANVLNDAYTLLKDNGANITNVGVQSFSNGGPGSMLALGGFLELNQGADINTKVVLCDTYNVEEIVSLYDKQKLNYIDEAKINAMNALINNNTEIYSLNWTSPKVYNHHADNVTACSKLLTEKGFNFSFSNSSRLQHVDYALDFFRGGGLDFLSGSGELNLDSRYYSGFYKYDENGNPVAYEIEKGIYRALAISANKKYNYLRDISNIAPTNSNVSSDTLYVYEQMNRLREQIRKSKFLSSNKKQVFKSGSGIPGCIGVYIDAYYNMIGSLMDSLMKETEVIASVASTFDDMGHALKTEAEELSPGEIPQLTPIKANSPAPVSDQNSTGGYEAQFDNSELEKKVHEQMMTIKDSPGKIIRPLYTSKIKEKMFEQMPLQKDSPGKISRPFKNSEIEEQMLKRLVQARPDGSKMEFSCNEDKVVDLKYVYEFSSNEEALNNMTVLQNKFRDVDYVSDIKVMNKNVEIIFKDDSYTNMTYDEVINKYLNGGN